jgi:hypothetical protein
MVEDDHWLPVVAVVAHGNAVPAGLFGHIVAGTEAPELLEAFGRTARQLRKLERR